MKIIRYSINFILTIYIGRWVSYFIAHLPYEFPPLPGTIAFILKKLGDDPATNGDDIVTIGLLVIIIASIIVAGLLVWLINIVILRYMAMRCAKT